MRVLASLGNARRRLAASRWAATHVGARGIGIVLLRVVAVLFCLQVAYLAIGNAVLRSRLIKARVEGGDGLHLDYAGAYTLWPGHVHLRELSFRFEDYNVQFEVALGPAELDISLTELLFKKFRVTKLDAQDTRFRFRHKLIVIGDDAERVAAYPPIRGFADPPYYRGVRPAHRAEDRELWEARIENVTARVSELWVMEYRFVGEGVAQGSFVVQPTRWVQVEPALLEMERGKLTLGRHVVAEQVRGRIRCSIPDMHVQTTDGVEVFGEISSSIRLELQRGQLDFLQAYLARLGPATYSGAASWLIDANIQRGVVQHGSHVTLAAEPARVEYRGMRAEGAVTALFERSALLAPDQLRLTWQAPRLVASRERARGAGPFVEGMSGELRLNAVDLKGDMSLGASKLSVSRVEAPTLAWFDVPAAELAGAARADFDLERSEAGDMSGRARFTLTGGGLKRQAFYARADATGVLSVHRASSAQAPWRFERLRLALSRVRLSEGSKHSEPFAAALDASGMRLELDASPSVQGGVKLHVSSTEALLPLVLSKTARDLGTTLVDLSALEAQAKLKIEAGGVEVTGIDARDGKLRLRGDMAKQGKYPSGAVLVSSGPLNVGVTFDRGATEVSPLVGDDWLVTTLRD
jgi:hypothetical protein